MNWLNRAVAHALPVVPRPIVGRVSARYIAGETLEDAVSTVRELNGAGMMATLDILGEFVATAEEARRAGAEYRRAIRVIAERGIDTNVSLKLTQLGLKVDVELCHEVARGVVEEASRLGNFVRLDMEDSSCTDDTLAMYRRLQATYPRHVGCVLQAYLRRSLDDARNLLPLAPNIRVCKGIYVEPPSIAYKDRDEIRDSFQRLVEEILAGGGYVGVATHDDDLVRRAEEYAARAAVARDRLEFQMLLGVRPALRAAILGRGHRLRVYVPFGPNWYAYSLRRLKENPAVAGHILRSMWNGG
jgi:proline dehydrogenase